MALLLALQAMCTVAFVRFIYAAPNVIPARTLTLESGSPREMVCKMIYGAVEMTKLTPTSQSEIYKTMPSVFI